MALYGQHGVQHSWLIDPLAKTLEIFRLESGRWVLLGAFSEDYKVRAEPFQEIEIDLSVLWLDGVASNS
jgi:Uma2 family endonuclease